MPLTVPVSTPNISNLLVAGHSRVAEGAAFREDHGISHKIAERFQARLVLIAQGGSCIAADEGATIGGAVRYGGIGRLLQFTTNPRTAAPYMAAWQAAVLDWGLNDMGWMGPATFATAFPIALRGAISRLRAGAIFEDTDSSVAYTGGSWANVAITSMNSGTQVKSVGTNGQLLTITVPADFPGGVINLRFVTGATGQGALWTITGTGSCAGVSTTHDTRNINGFDYGGSRGANGKLLNSVKRLTGLPAGAGTIVATATTISTVAYFDCWEIESPWPGLVAAGLDVRPVDYSLWAAWPYNVAAGFADADATTVVNTVASVAAEFDSRVFSVSADDLFNKQQIYFADAAHWNDNGHAMAADRLASAIASRATDQLSMTRAASFFKPYFYSCDGTGPGVAGVSINFANSWVDYDTTIYSPAGVRKDNLTGEVTIRGAVKKASGSATDTILTLPAGYRPPRTIQVSTPVFNGATWGMGVLQIASTGVVNIASGGSIAASSANMLNVKFLAEQ